MIRSIPRVWRTAAALGVGIAVVACRGTTDRAGDGVNERSGVGTATERRRVSPGEPFGVLPNGDSVRVFTLRNGDVTMRVTDYGGIVLSLETPDRTGTRGDIVLGHDDLDGYLTSSPYFGALIGRYGNRIAAGRFTLGDSTYTLATNNGPNALHGGTAGFDKVRWAVMLATDTSLTLRHVSRDGDEGYPGTLTATVTYALTPDNRWVIEYEARTDQPTPVNLTQHSYWNLSGNASVPVLDHALTIHAASYTPVDRTLIPTGVLAPVRGTPFDFQRPALIGARIADDHEQLRHGAGYDHNFVLTGARDAGGLVHAAHVSEPTSGRTLDVYTTEPGVQFYSGNFLDGTITGKRGAVYARRTGFCLETQHFPDSPNHPAFPSTILHPGTTLTSRTEYRFGVLR